MRKHLWIWTLLTWWALNLPAQNPYPQNYFAPPVNFTMLLSGNFGEIRPHHFHSGIDIKTNGNESAPVYAVADGYISRINVSPYGYGRALYINHPNGYTSVYAHLKNYNAVIDSILKGYQYQRESFEVDTLLAPFIYVKKGELIGYIGNTGSSQGPHLHFEIRDTKTETPINPLLFGYKISDNVAPRILSLNIYPLSDDAGINGEQKIKRMKTIEGSEYYHLDLSDSIVAHGDIGFGIECYDTETGSSSPNAVYSIELQSGGRRLYYAEFNKFSFEETRYVNTHIDYAEKENNSTKVQKCFVSKNNQLEFYKGLKNNGIINYNDDATHWMRIIVKDYSGNTSMLVFKVKGSTQQPITIPPPADTLNAITNSYFVCTADNKCGNDQIKVYIPNNALFDDIHFKIYTLPTKQGYYSPVFRIQNEETTLYKPYELSIRAVNLPAHLQNKAAIVSIGKKGKVKYEGGTYQNGWIYTKTYTFGNFSVITDNVAPVIKPTFKIRKDLADFTDDKEIRLLAWDNLSGIKKYRATVDGKWILLEYDAKSNAFFYLFDNRVMPGNHHFRMEVADDKNNTSILEFDFVR